MKYRQSPFTILLLSCLLLLTYVHAVQRSLAGKIDWHKSLIGVPRHDLEAGFVKLPQGGDGVVMVTERNVLAVLDAKDGEVVWRQVVEVEDVIVSYEVANDAVIVISGLGIPIVRSFSLSTGHVQWETLLRSTSGQPAQQLYEPLNLGSKIMFSTEGDVIVLSRGHAVNRLDAKMGEIKWTWSADENVTGSTQVDLVASQGGLTVISMIQSFASPQLAVTKLDSTTGSIIQETKPVKVNLASPKDYIVTESSKIHWIDTTTKQIKSALLESIDKQLPSGLKGTYQKIHDIGLASTGVFAAHNADGSEDLIRKDEKKPLGLQAFKTNFGQATLWQKSATSDQIVQGAFTEAGFTILVYDSKDLSKTTINNDIDHDIVKHGKIVSAITGPASESSLTIAVTSTGSIQCWAQGENGSRLLWAREESLSDVKTHVVIELPERKVEQTGAVLDQEGFLSRTIRHVKELIYLPSYASSLVSRFTSGSYTKSLSSTPLHAGNLFRDQFGFQKLVIMATVHGQVYAVDSAHGNIVWKTSLNDDASELDIVGMWNVRSGPEFGAPVVAIVANKNAAGKGISTVAYHIDAFTGKSLQSANDGSDALSVKTIADGLATRAFPIPVDHCKTHIQAIAVVAQDSQVHFFPSCNKIKSGFANISSQTFFHSTEGKLAQTSIQGYAISSSGSNVFSAYPTWALPLAADETIVDVAELQQGVIAAYGRVLGDRTTLYKYLNPHLVAYATISKHAGAGTVYVIDTTSGAIVHEASIPDVDVRTGIQVNLAENWLVYAYAEKEISGKSSRGQRLVSTELFEGAFPDERTNSLSASTLTGLPSVHAITRTFMVPVGIKRLGMTNSMHGITYKDLIIVTDRDQLVAVPKRMLDPRRPDVPSKRDKEEFLVPYQPMLFLDPKWTISHTYDVTGINKVITTPSLLESTSLIITTGLDLFGSRATPSGTFDILSDYFNKTQLMLTILGLGIGITVARPAVTRKVLKARWY